MTPYYEEAGVTIYHADARDMSHLATDSVITDPVWPNGKKAFPHIEDPGGLLHDVLNPLSCKRVVIQLGCDSDPRFLAAVPSRWPFLRVCSLEYAVPSYKGRVLYTGDVGYVFGEPTPVKKGAFVMPGKCLSTNSDKLFARKNGRNKSFTRQASEGLKHPSPRRLQHVRWLAKWFGGSSVLDPFAGSGTTVLACKTLGIPCIAVEIEERFCELIVSRLSQEVLALCEVSA